MKIKNTTEFDARFLRRMIGWVCRAIQLPVAAVRLVEITNCRLSSRGRAWPRRCLLRIGAADKFPREPFRYGGRMTPRCEDRIEGLIAIAAHELTHIKQYRDDESGRLEPDAVCKEHFVLGEFRKQREKLLAEWSAFEPKPVKQKPDIKEQRATKVFASLARWQRKLKLAQTKIRGLKRRARYYEKQQAASRAA